MRIIDLTIPIHTGMKVYPGDPEVQITQIHSLEKDGWNQLRVSMNTHDGTHVDVPYHMVNGGNQLDGYDLENYCGGARIFEHNQEILSHEGLIVRGQAVDEKLVQAFVRAKPKFLGLDAEYEIDTEIERTILEADIIIFERLVNLYELPDHFSFFGAPLSIRGGDGSPVRAFAIVE